MNAQASSSQSSTPLSIVDVGLAVLMFFGWPLTTLWKALWGSYPPDFPTSFAAWLAVFALFAYDGFAMLIIWEHLWWTPIPIVVYLVVAFLRLLVEIYVAATTMPTEKHH